MDRALREVLRRARRSKRLSQQELARRVRCEQPLISKIEKNRCGLEVAQFVALAKGIGADAPALLAEAIEMAAQPFAKWPAPPDLAGKGGKPKKSK